MQAATRRLEKMNRMRNAVLVRILSCIFTIALGGSIALWIVERGGGWIVCSLGIMWAIQFHLLVFNVRRYIDQVDRVLGLGKYAD